MMDKPQFENSEFLFFTLLVHAWDKTPFSLGMRCPTHVKVDLYAVCPSFDRICKFFEVLATADERQ